MGRKRVREIAMLVLHRHRGLPDNPFTRRIYLEAAAHHLKPKHGDLAFALENWARRLGSKLPTHEIDGIVKKVTANPRRFKADTLGSILRVTYAERTKAGLQTIGSFDVPKAERTKMRKERKRQRDRERTRLRRRSNGAMARAVYLANAISRQQPWLAQGISRATWYRRQPGETTQKNDTSPSPTTLVSHAVQIRETSPSPTTLISLLGDTPVSLPGGTKTGFASGLPPTPVRASRGSLSYSMVVLCSL
jgi:hypothetical protein